MKKENQQGNTEVSERIFPQVSYEEWAIAANKALKGKDLNEYYRQTDEGITIKPLYTEENELTTQERLFPLGQSDGTWKIAQHIEGDSIATLHENMMEAIENGQDTLSFELPFQLKMQDLNLLFEDIHINQVPFFINGKYLTIPFYSMLTEWNPDKASQIKGFIGSDPIAMMTENGCRQEEANQYYSYWCEGIKYASIHLPNVQTVYVDGGLFEKVGGHSVQQLAFSLATAVEHIEQLKNHQMSLQDIFKNMVFGFTVGSQFFMEIAKLRAVRFLWTKVIERYGFDPNEYPLTLFAETTLVNKSKIDPFTNLLRAGGEAFAAVLGQVQLLRITSFDQVTGDSQLGTRLSRNIHHLLREEAKLGQVLDPAGGSYYIEALTKELIEKAWQLFLDIEESGGMLQAIRTNKIQAMLEENQQKRLTALYRREITLVGTNRYVDVREKVKANQLQQKMGQPTWYPIMQPLLQIGEALKNGAALEQFIIKKSENRNGIKQMRTFRLSEEYECIRYQTSQLIELLRKPLYAVLIPLKEDKNCTMKVQRVADDFAVAGIQSEISKLNKNTNSIKKLTEAQLICFLGDENSIRTHLPMIQSMKEKSPKSIFICMGVNTNEFMITLQTLGIESIDEKTSDQLTFLNRVLDLLKGENHATEL